MLNAPPSPISIKHLLVTESNIPRSKSGTKTSPLFIHPIEKEGPSRTTPSLFINNASVNPFFSASLV